MQGGRLEGNEKGRDGTRLEARRREEKEGEIQSSSLGAVRVRSKEGDTKVKQDWNC